MNDQELAARARKLRAADVQEHTGETDPVLAYARWAGQVRDLLGELADALERRAGPPCDGDLPAEEE